MSIVDVFYRVEGLDSISSGCQVGSTRGDMIRQSGSFREPTRDDLRMQPEADFSVLRTSEWADSGERY